MKELTLSELRWYLRCLENTWVMYVGLGDNLAKSILIFEHLQKRYKNVGDIIKKKSTTSLDRGTYHIVKELKEII